MIPLSAELKTHSDSHHLLFTKAISCLNISKFEISLGHDFINLLSSDIGLKNKGAKFILIEDFNEL